MSARLEVIMFFCVYEIMNKHWLSVINSMMIITRLNDSVQHVIITGLTVATVRNPIHSVQRTVGVSPDVKSQRRALAQMTSIQVLSKDWRVAWHRKWRGYTCVRIVTCNSGTYTITQDSKCACPENKSFSSRRLRQQ